MIDTEMTLADGRTVSYTVIGAERGPTVFYFHGAPTSRLDLAPFADHLRDARIRAVSIDRPGYGASTPQPGRTLDDPLRDVIAVADAFETDRFATIGMSSGGPYAVRAGSFFGERCASSAVVAGITDMSWAPAWDGFFEPEAKLIRAGGDAATLALADELFGADGARFAEYMGEMAPADLELFSDPEMAAGMMGTMGEAFRQGNAGMAADCVVESQPWAFDLGATTAPVTVWHGSDDRLVPLAHAQHTAELVPGATLEILHGHGHLSIVGEFPTILARVAEPLL